MADQLLIRKVPRDVRSWIDRERRQQGMTQQEFVLSVLEQALETRDLPLFAPIRKPEAFFPEAIPLSAISLKSPHPII